MKNDQGSHRGYVQRVREDTRRYISELLAENERLRKVAALLEDEKSHLQSQLDSQADLLKQELNRRETEKASLNQRLQEIEAQNQRFTAKYTEVERQNANLANLYVASYRLHGTMSRE